MRGAGAPRTVLPPDHYCSSPDLSERVAALLARDVFAMTLNARLVAISPGRAELAMEIAPPLTNVHGDCHGGALFTFADLAFGASAIYRGPLLTAGADLNFVRTAPAGAIVRASAIELARTAKTGLFEVTLAEDALGLLAIGVFRALWTAAGRADAAPSPTGRDVADETTAGRSMRRASREKGFADARRPRAPEGGRGPS